MTEQFTPSTERVEDAYTYDPEYEYYHPGDSAYHLRNRRVFRRWLDSVKAAAWQEGYNVGFTEGYREVYDPEVFELSENPYIHD